MNIIIFINIIHNTSEKKVEDKKMFSFTKNASCNKTCIRDIIMSSHVGGS